jgi:hypothetical protein
MKRENIREQIEYLKDIGVDTTSCFECGSKEDIEYHHIIPYAWGGRRVIPLCGNCHNMVHKGRTRKDSHRELVKAGIEKKKQEAIEAGIEWKWGSQNLGTANTADLGRMANKEKATRHQYIVLEALEGCPFMTLAEKAEWLNTKTNIKTRRGCSWTSSNLHRVLKRSTSYN